jgi:hypothetical protein
MDIEDMKTKLREINLAAQNWMAIERKLAVKMKRITTTVWGEMPMTVDERPTVLRR